MDRAGQLLVAAAAAAAFAIAPVGAARASSEVESTSPAFVLDARERARVLESLFDVLDRYYVFPEVAKALRKAVGAKAARGDYDKFTNGDAFAAAVSADLQLLSRDRHLGISYSASSLPADDAASEEQPEDPATLEKHRAFGRRVNYGFSQVEMLPGEIGYVKLDGFFDLLAGGTHTAAAVMTFVRNSRALIFDMRENEGGHPSMGVLLLSYLFHQPVRLSDFYRRDRSTLQQNWTSPFVPGERFFGPVYVLTSQKTISAPEGFAYDLQAHKRATVVGERTAGAANPGLDRRIHLHFTAFIPFGRAINPLTRTNWEGTGVTPDIAARAQDALRVAQKHALETAIAKESTPREVARLRGILKQLN